MIKMRLPKHRIPQFALSVIMTVFCACMSLGAILSLCSTIYILLKAEAIYSWVFCVSVLCFIISGLAGLVGIVSGVYSGWVLLESESGL
jgi:hypothetical protein